MKRYVLFLTVAALAFFIFAQFAAGQDLRKNEHYLKAIELQKKAEQALAAGDYDKAYEYSEEAKKQTKLAADLYALLVQKYRANSLLQQVSDRIASVKNMGITDEFRETFETALSDYEDAKTAFNEGDYELSMDYSRKVLSALVGYTRPAAVEIAEAEEAEEEAEAEAPEEEERAVLPKYYRVRLIPGRRDCFWRIAEYDFVYGDPFKWRILYRANKEKLKYPDNPDLIFPGQVFEIPELEGEVREGEWKPGE